MKVVIDASVAIKWFFDEEGKSKADELLAEIQNNNTKIIVPNLFFYELANVLLSKKITEEYLRDIVKSLYKLNLTRLDVGFDSLIEVYLNAEKFGISFYDSSYFTLAQEENAEFVTADKKLHDKLKNKFSSAKLL